MQGGEKHALPLQNQQATAPEPSRPKRWPHRDSPSRRIICRLSPRDPACLPPPPRPEDGLPIEATILEAGQLHVANEARHVLGDQLLHSHARVNGPKLILIQVVPARIVKVPSCLRANLRLNQDCAFGPCPEPRELEPPTHLCAPSTPFHHAGNLPQRPQGMNAKFRGLGWGGAPPPQQPSTAERPGPVPHGPAVLARRIWVQHPRLTMGHQKACIGARHTGVPLQSTI